MAVSTVSAVPVLAPNLLHVIEKEEQTKRKTKGDREKDRRRKRKVDLMTIGTVAAVPVLATNLLHVVETLTPVWHALARIVRPSLLHEKENQIIFVVSRQNF
jgi:hypothetical protein